MGVPVRTECPDILPVAIILIRDKALAFLEGYPDSDVLRSLRLFADFVLSRDK